MVIMGSDNFHLDPMIGGYLNTLSPFSGSGISDEGSVMLEDLTQLQLRHLRSNVEMAEYGDAYEVSDEYDGVQMDDQFRMYEFKVKRCGRGRSHDWTDCPYAHPGEKARRRDPRKYHYSGNPCAEFRKGGCRKGDGCEFAHGVFECWLHPSRYRTQPCKDGLHCPRRICFFAHTPEQLRILPPSYHVSIATQSYDGSPSQGSFGSSSSPTSTLYFPHCSTPTDSPPMSPLGLNSVGDLAFSMRNLQIGKSTRLMNGYSPPQIQHSVRPTPSPPWLRALELWDDGDAAEEGMMERVESGKDIRARIYAKLSRENSLSESRGV